MTHSRPRFLPTSCPLQVNDGAYILGALAPAERAEFEEHLATCPSCRESVALLAGLPGLLGRLDPQSVLPSVSAPPDVLPRVVARARSERAAQRRRQLLTTAAACVAAAVVAGGVAIGVQLVATPRDPGSVVATGEPVRYTAMQAASEYSPVEAEIGISADETGTLVSVRCLYQSLRPGQWPIWLVVYPRDEGEAEAIGSWVATAGAQVSVTAVTHYAPAQIDRIELQGTGSTTIAWWSP